MSGFDFAAMRAALQELEEPPSIVARLQMAMLPAGHRAAASMAEALDDYERDVARSDRARGFRADGSRVTQAEKVRILARAERIRTAHLAELGDEEPAVPLAASALPLWAGGERLPLYVV